MTSFFRRGQPLYCKGKPPYCTGKTSYCKELYLPTGDGLVFEAVDNILFIEASGSYTTVHLTGGHKYLGTKKISDIEQVLPCTIFFRVHNSFAINTHKIRKYQKGRGGFVVMENGASIEVSTRKRDEFLERFQL